MINKTRILNQIFHHFGFQIKRGSFFFRPSTEKMKSLKRKNLVCIEVGTHKGRNAFNILENLNIKKIYLVDPYLNYGEFLPRSPNMKKVGNKTFFEAKKRLRGFKDKIEFIKEFSDKAISRFKDNSIDFIYIDGNHDYKFVKKDIELYYPKLKKGGIIAGHDIDLKDVFRAVSEFCVKNKLECEIEEKDWIIRK
jgi:hypothetical protein